MPNNNLIVPITNLKQGFIAEINGKTYTVINHYQHYRHGVFFLAVAGRTPLKTSDLAKHFKVIRHNNIYLAFHTRLFSYHLINNSSTNAPRWPKLKSLAYRIAFVGPTEQSIHTQIRLTIERYAPNRKNQVDFFIENAQLCMDTCKNGPPAYLIERDSIT